MQPTAQNAYLETEVMTATPQKLQLMLIDAAIRSIKKARLHWQEDQDDIACEALIHAQQVVTEMLTGLNPEVDADLTKKVASVYLFIFRRLIDANVERDDQKLGEALGVLEIERDTWQKVCEQLGDANGNEGEAAGISLSPQAASLSHAAIPPAPSGLPVNTVLADDAPTGFSLEA